MKPADLSPRALAVGPGKATIPAVINITPGADGTWVLEATHPGATELVIELRCGLGEHFVGLGEQFSQLDKRGRVIDGRLGRGPKGYANFTVGLDGYYKGAPLYYSSAGYAAFLDSRRPWRVELAATDPTLVRVSVRDQQARLVLADGMPLQAIPRVTALTGRPPLAPPWAYGVWKNVSGEPESVLAEARRLRDEAMGCSALWVFAFYDAASNTGCGAGGSYPVANYDDLPALVNSIHEAGYRALTYLNSWFYRGTPTFIDAAARGYLLKDETGAVLLVDGMHPVGGTGPDHEVVGGLNWMRRGQAFLDLFNPAARAYWQGLLHSVLTDQGFDGWMQDFGEGLPTGAVPAGADVNEDLSNALPLLYHATAREEIERTRPGAVFFARSGYLGSQADAPVMWPADQTRDWSRWSGIGSLPPAAISAGLMGIAAWGPDIAGCMGFAGLGDDFGSGSGDRELWIRWCQLGAMSPLMRDHLGFHEEAPVDAWHDAETIDTWRRCAAWHNRLFPYLYTYAHGAARTGLPVVRGMMLGFPENTESWVVGDQYMLGEALLCAPVLESGARERRVWLPDGEWFDWWTGRTYPGGAWAVVPAPLERWPVLQRSGTVVPLLASAPADLNDPRMAAGDFDLELAVCGGAGRFELFDGTVVEVSGGAISAAGGRDRAYHLRRLP